MRFGAYEFRPRWRLTIITLAALAILVALGFWQLERAQEKRLLRQQQQQVEGLPAVDLNDTPSYTGLKQEPYRRVTATGRFDSSHQILVDNKTHEGQVGYDVVTPLILEGGKRAVLVNRGWVAMGRTRKDLPSIPTPATKVTVEGMIKIHLKDVISLGHMNQMGKDWPVVVQWLDLEQLKSASGLKLLPFVILQAPGNEHGFVRDWHIVNATPARHISYAVQWFVIATALAVVYVILSSTKVEADERD
jgi:surfeit locus 1 family protein